MTQQKSEEISKPDLLIFDGSQLAYASGYKNQNLVYKQYRTGILYGVLTTILSIYEKFPAKEVHIAWDSLEFNLRKIFDSEYKSNRIYNEERLKLVEDITSQIPLLRHGSQLIGIYNWEFPGFEADDIMHILAHLDKEKRSVIVTTDGDLLQSISKSVSIYDQRKKIEIGLKEFQEKYKIQPKDWALVKAIGGCSSDNVKGIKGVSSDTALKFVRGEEIRDHQFEKIGSDKGIATIAHCLTLVKLPYRVVVDDYEEVLLVFGKSFLSRKSSTVDLDAFIMFCRRYGMQSFLHANDKKMKTIKRMIENSKQ